MLFCYSHVRASPWTGATLKDAQVAVGVTVAPGATIKGEAVDHDREEDE